VARAVKKGFLTPGKAPTWLVLGSIFEHGEKVEVARRSGFPPGKWQRWTREPEDREDFTGSGRHNPLDTFSILAQFIREMDGNVKRFEPVAQYVANLSDGFFVPAPRKDFDEDEDIIEVAGEVMKECGETLVALRTGFEDRKFSVDEVAKIEKEASEAQAALELVKNFARTYCDE